MIVGSLAYAQKIDDQLPGWGDLPDWAGPWQMTSNTVFDQATVDPPGGSSNTPGTVFCLLLSLFVVNHVRALYVAPNTLLIFSFISGWFFFNLS